MYNLYNYSFDHRIRINMHIRYFEQGSLRTMCSSTGVAPQILLNFSLKLYYKKQKLYFCMFSPLYDSFDLTNYLNIRDSVVQFNYI